MAKSNPNSPATPCRSINVEKLHKYVLPKEDYVEQNGHVKCKNHHPQEDERVLAKAATFVYILFQIFYLYFVDIVKRTIYLTSLQQSVAVEDDDEITQKDLSSEISKKSNEVLPKESCAEEVLIIPNNKLRLISPVTKPPKAVSKKPIETNYITTVFEVQNHGLKLLIEDISEEIRRWQLSDELIACCEVVWSVPTKYRNYPAEIRLKNEIFSCLRSNSQRIFDLEKWGNENLLRCPVSSGITEETAGKRNGCYVGVYRKYYQELFDIVHEETQPAHENAWKFDSKTMEPKFDWPMIGSLENTAVVMLNVICVKF